VIVIAAAAAAAATTVVTRLDVDRRLTMIGEAGRREETVQSLEHNSVV